MAGAALVPLGAMVAPPAEADLYTTLTSVSTTSPPAYDTTIVIDFPDGGGIPLVYTFLGPPSAAGAAYPEAELFVLWYPSAKLSLLGINPDAGATTDQKIYFMDAPSFPPDYHEVIPAGKTIGSASGPFSYALTNTYSMTSPFDLWSKGDKGYVGFVVKDGGTGYSYYGFVGLELSTTGYTGTIFVVTWDTTMGAGVVTGIPEASSLALGALALGAAGLGAWRRRRDRAT